MSVFHSSLCPDVSVIMATFSGNMSFLDVELHQHSLMRITKSHVSCIRNTTGTDIITGIVSKKSYEKNIVVSSAKSALFYVYSLFAFCLPSVNRIDYGKVWSTQFASAFTHYPHLSSRSAQETMHLRTGIVSCTILCFKAVSQTVHFQWMNEKETRNAWQSLAYSALGATVSPPSK